VEPDRIDDADDAEPAEEVEPVGIDCAHAAECRDVEFLRESREQPAESRPGAGATARRRLTLLSSG
jgi:hypothetical protein